MSERHGNDSYTELFSPRDYLRQYYSLPRLAKDDAALFRRLTGWLDRTGRVYESAVDLGCGPTIHNSFALAPYVKRLTLADYLDGNLAEIRKWLEQDADAHDWDPLLRDVLAQEPRGMDGGGQHSALELRKAMHRSRVAALRHCNLLEQYPLGRPESFDLVTSFFCPECIVSTKDAWLGVMSRVLGMVAPGGAVYFAAVRQCRAYSVLGRWFQTVPIDERDFSKLLLDGGFCASSVEAVAIPAPDWAEDGFDHIVLVHGQKS